MGLYNNKKNLFYKLKKNSIKSWKNYTEHSFIKGIGDGSLRSSVFIIMPFFLNDASIILFLSISGKNFVMLFSTHSIKYLSGNSPSNLFTKAFPSSLVIHIVARQSSCYTLYKPRIYY